MIWPSGLINLAVSPLMIWPSGLGDAQMRVPMSYCPADVVRPFDAAGSLQRSSLPQLFFLSEKSVEVEPQHSDHLFMLLILNSASFFLEKESAAH